MKTDIVSGINENSLLKLCIEIDKFADRISEIFKKIDDDMEEIKNYYSSDTFTTLYNLYEDLRKNYSVIKKNIFNYSGDLNELINKMKKGILDMTQLYLTFSENYRIKKTSIEMMGGIE